MKKKHNNKMLHDLDKIISIVISIKESIYGLAKSYMGRCAEKRCKGKRVLKELNLHHPK